MTLEAEADLVARVKRNEHGAYDQLHEQFKYWIANNAYYWRDRNPWVDIDDLMQEGRIGLFLAAQRFEAERGWRFLTYATYWLRQRMSGFVDRRGDTIKRPQKTYGKPKPARICMESIASVFVDASVASVERPEIGAEHGDEMDRLDRALSVLAPRDRLILERRFLGGETQQQIADSLGITKSRVQQIEARAIRQARRADRLSQYEKTPRPDSDRSMRTDCERGHSRDGGRS